MPLGVGAAWRIRVKIGSGFDLLYERLLASGRGAPAVREGADSVHVTIPRRVIQPGVIRLVAEADKRYQLTQRERIGSRTAIMILGLRLSMRLAHVADLPPVSIDHGIEPWSMERGPDPEKAWNDGMFYWTTSRSWPKEPATLWGPRRSPSDPVFVLDTGTERTIVDLEIASRLGFSERDSTRRSRVVSALGAEEGFLVTAPRSAFGSVAD